MTITCLIRFGSSFTGSFLSVADRETVALDPRRRLALLGQPADHRLGYSLVPCLVLSQQRVKRRFEVDDLDAGVVVSKQIEPPATSLPHRVGGIEGE